MKLIITDLDGCISPEQSIAWDIEGFAALARLCRHANDGSGSLAPITFCTGRPQPYCEVLMKLLDVRLPVICESGAVFYTLADNRARFSEGVGPDAIRGLRKVREFVESQILPANPDALIQFGKEAQVSIYCPRTEAFADMKQRVEQFNFQQQGPELEISASVLYLNISLSQADKGAAARQLIGELGLKKEDVAGIGDTAGDMPLREAVGFFACPANAIESLRAAADYVSPFPTLRGVADILRQDVMKK